MPEKKQPEPNGDEQSLKQQIKELQRQLALSELKVEALETMIDTCFFKSFQLFN